ncbi:hypothetical protein IQ251_11235 [Saccharopolyspora sp. HNM0983]|uniref:Zinc-finger n=2 Tax=Saccharopolyspora montiporae TaxID=2781240 RepID=A0A929B864_9PSEU|nr:hypothetical protein [Saccharopolyspora sp. HNM0983]
MGEYPGYVWRPVTGGRHAFDADDRRLPRGRTTTAFCGADVDTAELHDRTETDWIREPTCAQCWRILADRPREPHWTDALLRSPPLNGNDLPRGTREGGRAAGGRADRPPTGHSGCR